MLNNQTQPSEKIVIERLGYPNYKVWQSYNGLKQFYAAIVEKNF